MRLTFLKIFKKSFSKNSSFDHDDDISEADPNDIAKILQDTDDIDGGLFKGANKSNNNLSKTLPISANKPTATVQKNKSTFVLILAKPPIKK